MHANGLFLLHIGYQANCGLIKGKWGLVFQPFLDFRVEIFIEDGHFLAISVFMVTGLKSQNKKQFRVRVYRQFWEKFIDMSQKFVDEYRECQ